MSLRDELLEAHEAVRYEESVASLNHTQCAGFHLRFQASALDAALWIARQQREHGGSLKGTSFHPEVMALLLQVALEERT